MNEQDVTDALAAVAEAMKDPHVSLHLVTTFTHGRGVQVMIQSRKIGPILFPPEGGDLTDILTMLGDMAGKDVNQ